MASLRRKPNSRFWIACYTDHNGVQCERSTKITARPLAQKIADKCDAAYKMKLTEAQARSVVLDIYEEVRGDVLFHPHSWAINCHLHCHLAVSAKEKRHLSLIMWHLVSWRPHGD